MTLFSMNTRQARVLFAQAGAALAIAAVVAGCGDNYRPVVTPVNSSGPPAQVTAYALVISSPSVTSPGIVTIIDYSGDSVLNETPIGPGPTAFTIDEIGATGYTVDSDGTLSNFAITTSLQAKNVSFSTLPTAALPVNLMAPSSGLWVTDLNGNVVDQFSGSPQGFKLAIPVATAGSPATLPVMVAGSPNLQGEREYVLSQNVASPIACNATPKTSPLGVATPIEIASNTTDPAIPVGKCPVYAVESSDQQRLFVLNRGDDTVTVINTRNNTLDTCIPFLNQNGQLVHCHPTLPLSLTAVAALNAITPGSGNPPNGTAGMGTIAGPVFAQYNQATQQLIIANYDGGTISVVDCSLDEYGNDGPTFGTTYTIAVGNTATPNPASVTVLFDGSKAYTANQNDGVQNGTVTVVNLSTHTVEKTLTVVGHPRTVASTQNSEFSKIYVASPDSPYITIVESSPTVTDLIDTTVLVEGDVVDLRVTTQNGNSGTDNYTSRVPGYGQPCNLPGAASIASLAACQAHP
jgi:DNA-binding beta-propeller fold protein YncE